MFKLVINIIFKYLILLRKMIYRITILPLLRIQLGSCGKKVFIGENCRINLENLFIGNNVSIGGDSLFMCKLAKIKICNNVILAPNVSIITGNHRVDIIGKYMININENEKLEENDQEVVIEDDVWIGTNVTILKGVKIFKGCVIAAGSVVTKSTLPYGIYAGNPAKRIKDRFTFDEIQLHEWIIENNDKSK